MHPRHFLAALVASATTLALAAAPANAAFDSWSGLPGLNSAAGANWVREYAKELPTTLYAATEDDGVWKSDNLGVTWSNFSSGLQNFPGAKSVRTVYPTSGRVLAGTTAGLFSNSGSGWTPLAQGPEDDPANPKKLNRAVQTLFAGAPGQLLAGTLSGGVYKSSDNGATWTPPAPGNGMPAAETVWSLTSLLPNVIFAATSSGIYRSLDFGSTWTYSSDGISGTTLRVFADGTRPNIYYAATPGNGVFRSIDAGFTWSQINGSGSHALGNSTVRGLEQFNGVNETRLYAGTGNGLYVGTTSNGLVPGPVSWRKVTNTGLGGNTIFWTLRSFLTSPDTVFAGTQSNGGYALSFTPPSNTAPPVVTGPLQIGTTLLATHGSWNGTPTIEFEYQWQECTTSSAGSCTDIADATDTSYVIPNDPAKVGRRYRIVVTAKNDAPTFSLIKAASAITGQVALNPNSNMVPGDTQQSAATVILFIDSGADGFPQTGDTLRATGWLFNPAATSTKFQWYRCDANGNNCDPKPGATAQNYLLTDDDVGTRLRVAVIGTNQYGTKTLGIGGGLSNTIFPEQATILSPATLDGSPYVGDSLVSGVGIWKYPGTTWKRQWESCSAAGDSCQTISGETGPAYKVRADDLGDRLRVRITADSNGPTFPAPVEVVTPLSGVITTPPPAPLPPPVAPGGGGGGGAGGGGAGGGGTGGSAGGGGGGGGGADLTPPALQTLSLKSRKVKRGGTLGLGYALSEPGSLSVVIQSVAAGRKKGKKCVKGLKKGKKCKILKTVATQTLAALAGNGTASVKLKKGKKNLPAGSYQVVITPIDAAGNKGPSQTVKFTITRK